MAQLFHWEYILLKLKCSLTPSWPNSTHNVVKYSWGLNETALLHTQGGAAIHVELVSGEQKGKQVQASRYPTVVGIL